MKKFESQVGKKVWLLPTGNYSRYHNVGLEEAIITKIARKYFYCERKGWEKFPIKFRIDNFSSVCEDCNAGYNIYETLEMYVAEEESNAMYSQVRSFFSDFGNKKPSYDTMRKIASLLYSEDLITKSYEGYCKDINGRHKVKTIYANQNANYEYGDIYKSRYEAAKDHPTDKIVFGFCVIDTLTGLIPDGCNDWNDTVEEAISDFERYKERKGEEK